VTLPIVGVEATVEGKRAATTRSNETHLRHWERQRTERFWSAGPRQRSAAKNAFRALISPPLTGYERCSSLPFSLECKSLKMLVVERWACPFQDALEGLFLRLVVEPAGNRPLLRTTVSVVG